jgi:hypothetical protein
MPRNTLLWISLGLYACGGDGTQAIKTGFTDTSVDVDEDPPLIEHTPLERQIFQTAVTVSATVTDEESAVGTVTLFYRQADSVELSELNMQGDGTGLYSTQIAAAEVISSGMFYFITASDEVGNAATLPIEGDSAPFYFRISAD